MPALRWNRINARLPRSSHSISLVDNKAYIYGGEINPREPVDGDVHQIDVSSGAYDRIKGSGDIPQPRVGHVAGVIGGNIYVFGGRGGPAMSPLDEAGAVYSFSPSTRAWTKLAPTSAEYPCPRSYHAGTATPTHLVVHAGCAASGRLNDIWLFNVASREWTRGPDAPGDGRGGTAITFASDKIWRFGGFNGKTELGGAIDALTLDATPGWNTFAFGETAGLGRDEDADLVSNDAGPGPGPRSVSALVPLGDKIISLFGEGKPSHTGGHDAAGKFYDDTWSYDPISDTWSQIGQDPDRPAARGWFAADHTSKHAIVWGGLNANNERLDDGWVATL